MENQRSCNDPNCSKCNYGRYDDFYDGEEIRPRSYNCINCTDKYKNRDLNSNPGNPRIIDTRDYPRIKKSEYFHPNKRCDEYYVNNYPQTRLSECREREYPDDKYHRGFDGYPSNHDHNEYLDGDITDEFLLNYLLRRYNLDKYKLINMIKKNRKNETKHLIIQDFYNLHRDLINKSLDEQYHIFKKWNDSEFYISKTDLEDYLNEYINSY